MQPWELIIVTVNNDLHFAPDIQEALSYKIWGTKVQQKPTVPLLQQSCHTFR